MYCNCLLTLNISALNPEKDLVIKSCKLILALNKAFWKLLSETFNLLSISLYEL